MQYGGTKHSIPVTEDKKLMLHDIREIAIGMLISAKIF